MASRKFFNLNDPDDLVRIHQILFDNIDEDGEIQPGASSYDLEEDECDTDASEDIKEREKDKETEQSSTDVSSDEEEEGDFYICHRKQGKKAIESFSWKKKLLTINRKELPNII